MLNTLQATPQPTIPFMSSHGSEKRAEELSRTPSFDNNESTVIGMSDEEKTETPSDTEDVEAQQPDSQAQKLTGMKLALVFLGICLSVFVTSLDQTIVSTSLPRIASDFAALDQISWVGTGYLLTSTAFQPLYGKFSDIFGRKATFLFALIIFEIGSILCGYDILRKRDAAQNMIMLVIVSLPNIRHVVNGSINIRALAKCLSFLLSPNLQFRAFQGIGGGGIMSMAMIVISDIVSMRDRGKYQGVIGACYGLSSVIGPLIGGAFTDDISWRWNFYLNLPIGGLAIAVIVFFLQLPQPKSSMREKIARIDFLGTITLICACVAILLAVQWGGNTYAWNSAIIISLFVVGVVLIGALVIIETYYAKEPIIPGYLYSQRTPLSLFVTSCLVGMAFFTLIYYLPVYFQVVEGESATSSGLELIPLMVGLIICNIFSGRLVSRTGRYRIFIIGGMAITTVGAGLLSTWKANSSRGEQIGYLLICGVGFGLSMQTITLAAQASVTYKDVAVITTLVSFWRTIGGVLGVAIAGSIFNNKLSSELTALNLTIPIGLAENSVAFVHDLRFPIKNQVIDGYVASLDIVYAVAIPQSGAAFLASLFLQHFALKKTVD
ncbi:major facilitator superfamily-domain-containing protein [Endogone sp. FLAS-F59071]|nr:major facilitator superfamily-domain-containing protein [Endogone sp. FLAS-F59071]|eukprot:RUS15319.1 major facilitator superfamily-domain-containing protein [Endogone sp. FLAS-F59071]